MGIHQQVAPAPMPAVARILAGFEREQVEGFIAVALELLDTLDGDADLELAGDETDGNGTEDEECAWFAHYDDGPGCTIADPDYGHDGS